MQWVHSSVQAGYCLDEEDFDMGVKPEGAKTTKEDGSSTAMADWAGELDEFVVPTTHGDDPFIDGCKVSCLNKHLRYCCTRLMTG